MDKDLPPRMTMEAVNAASFARACAARGTRQDPAMDTKELDEAFARFKGAQVAAANARSIANDRKSDAERAESFARNAETEAANAKEALLTKLGAVAKPSLAKTREMPVTP